MINGLPIAMLNGLGCNCQGGVLGAAADYDLITVGGKQYSAGQLVGKSLTVTKDVYLYQGLSNDNGKVLVKSGQTAGKVSTYILPTSKTNPTGKVALGVDIVLGADSPPVKQGLAKAGQLWTYWLRDDNAVSQAVLKDQGALTIKQQVDKEQEELLKNESPIEFYVKKYAGKVLLIGVLAYAAVEIGKQLIKTKASKAVRA
jgi:hypothetical protein